MGDGPLNLGQRGVTLGDFQQLTQALEHVNETLTTDQDSSREHTGNIERNWWKAPKRR